MLGDSVALGVVLAYAEAIIKGALFMRGSKLMGLRTTVSVITLAIFGVLAVTGLSLYRQNHISQQAKPPIALNASQRVAATATWNTYNDTGYASASTISLKYPSDWKINITGVKTIGSITNPTGVINERGVFLPTAETSQEEWDTCATKVSGDACGAAPGDRTLSGSESTINGLDVYMATMQNSYSTYHVAVIRGNKPTADGVPFVEFTTWANDPAALDSFNAIMASATFPN